MNNISWIWVYVVYVVQISESPSEIMESLTVMYNIPKDKQTLLFTHIRLAHGFSNHKKRLQAVQARLHAISILGKFFFPGTLWKSFLRVLTTDTSDSLQYIQTHSKSLPTVFCTMDWLRSWWMYCRSQTNSLWWENIKYLTFRADIGSKNPWICKILNSLNL